MREFLIAWELELVMYYHSELVSESLFAIEKDPEASSGFLFHSTNGRNSP
jgi:hypothetical protein